MRMNHPANDPHNLADAVMRAQSGMTEPPMNTQHLPDHIQHAATYPWFSVFRDTRTGDSFLVTPERMTHAGIVAACEERRAQRTEPPPLEVVRIPAAPIIAMLFGLLFSSAFLGWGLVRLIQFFSK